MKRIHRLRLLVVALLALATLLPGTVGRAASSATITLRFAYFGGPQTEALINQILPSFTKAYPNVSVSLEPFPTEGRVKVLTEISAGTAADVYMVGDGDAVFLASRGAVVDLKPLAAAAHFDLGQYIAGTTTVGTIGNHVYALPKDYSPLAVYYNKDMFRRAGVPYPAAGWTWNDFRNDALKLTKNGVYGALLPGDWVRCVDAVVRSLGGQLDNSNGTKTVGYMNSPATIKAIQFWINLFTVDKVSPLPSQTSALGSDPFASGKTAMSLTGVWPSLGPTGYSAKPPFSIGVAPFPSGYGHTMQHVNTICYAGFVLSKSSKHINEAFALIRYLSGPVGSAVWAQNGLPAVRSVALDKGIYNNPIDKVFLNEVTFTDLPADINGPSTEEAIGDNLTKGLDLLLNTPGTSVSQVLNIEANKAQAALSSKT
jgi:multiple sugar transport system substrate-binding protein